MVGIRVRDEQKAHFEKSYFWVVIRVRKISIKKKCFAQKVINVRFVSEVTIPCIDSSN